MNEENNPFPIFSIISTSRRKSLTSPRGEVEGECILFYVDNKFFSLFLVYIIIF